MDSMLPILGWWVGLLLPGWVAYVWLKPYFDRLPDFGYALSKVVGLIGLSYLAWLLASLHIVPFGSVGVTVILALALVSAGWRIFKQRQPITNYLNRLILAEEGIMAAALLGWSFVRSFNPRAEGVEKMMDVAILNGLLRGDWLPPKDVWYAGEPTNYYYFGHFIVATISKLTHVPVEYAVNLGLIGVFALVATVTFGLVVAMTASKVAAALSVFLLSLSSNLDPAINSIKQTKDYIFFSATRLDPYTINEFPLYSFIVADMHAHMLDLPVVVAIIALLYVLFSYQGKLPIALLFILTLLLGATGPTNSFDLAVYGGLIGLVILVRQFAQTEVSWHQFGRAVAITALIGIGSLALYAPFYIHFHVPVGGVGVALFRTPLLFILNNFGIMLFICLPLFWLLPKVWRELLNRDAVQPGESASSRFGVVLLVFALLVIAVPEFIYLKDIYSFQNPPYARANTIFKVYYQAWVLLAIAAGVGLSRLHSLQWHRRWNNLYVVIAGGLIGLSLVGTWSGFSTLKDHTPTTINGYAFLQTERPDQLAMIDWMNTHIKGQPTILEASGESYTQRSAISTYTGLPVPVGWASHEWGWRYSPTTWNTISAKMGDMDTMYTTRNPDQLRQLVQKWDIKYIVASPVEKEQYGLRDFATIASTYGEPIFRQGLYELYRVE